MKIFISWSGEQAKQVAEFLKQWLTTVLAGSVDAFVSSQDIAKGERGLNVIAKELEAINYGIVVLTKTNVTAPWVNFEAGALAKSLGEGHVSTVLVDVTRTDITGPLSQFQDTVMTDRTDVRKLVDDIAKVAGGGVPAATIDVLYEGLWPQLEAAVEEASGGGEPTTARGSEDILEEVLEIVRGIQRDARTQAKARADEDALLIRAIYEGAGPGYLGGSIAGLGGTISGLNGTIAGLSGSGQLGLGVSNRAMTDAEVRIGRARLAALQRQLAREDGRENESSGDGESKSDADEA